MDVREPLPLLTEAMRSWKIHSSINEHNAQINSGDNNQKSFDVKFVSDKCVPVDKEHSLIILRRILKIQPDWYMPLNEFDTLMRNRDSRNKLV